MKIGIITGASSGLGREYARRAIEEFTLDELWLVARREGAMRDIAASMPERRIRILPCDLSKTEDIEALCAKIRQASPQIRLLVNNAGLGFLGDFETVETANDRAMCDVNMRAPTLLTAAAIPYMSKGAAIIFVSSIAAFAPTPRMSVYCSTKAYIQSLAKALRYELAPRGIHVLAVYPCPMDTDFLAVGGINGNSRTFDRLPRCLPEKVARVSLSRAAAGKGSYTPLVLMKMYRVLAKLLPHNLIMPVSKT